MKVIISDTDETHAYLVKQAVMLGHGSLDESDVYIYDLGASLEDAILFAEGEGATLVVRSTPGASSLLSVAETYYLDGDYILVCMPAGSNSPGEVFHASIPQAMCITGAGDLNNETGDNVEFISPDPITIEPDLSSYSNGYIAGQLLKIKEERGGNWEDARIAARATSSENGIWHEVNGYGLINVEAAIAYEEQIGEFGDLSYSAENDIPALAWDFTGQYDSFTIYRRIGRHGSWTEVQGGITDNHFTDSSFARNIKPTFYKVKAIFVDQSTESESLRIPLIEITDLYYKKLAV